MTGRSPRAAWAGGQFFLYLREAAIHKQLDSGDTTACMLDWSLPGGQDHYFKAISELGPGGFASEKVTEINEKFDTTFLPAH